MAELDKTTPLKLTVIFYIIFLLPQVNPSPQNELSSIIKSLKYLGFTGSIHVRGSRSFDKFRRVQNGACDQLVPLLVVRPRSARDVSRAVRVSRTWALPISVRSGGHSYTCTNMKQDSMHIDLTSMDKVQLVSAFRFERKIRAKF